MVAIAPTAHALQTSGATSGHNEELSRSIRERFTLTDTAYGPKKPDRPDDESKDREKPTATEPLASAEEDEQESNRTESQAYSATNKFYGEVIAVIRTSVQAWIEVAGSLRIRTVLPKSLFSEVEPISGTRFLWHESTAGIAGSRVEPAPGVGPTLEDLQEIEQLSREFTEKWANEPLPLDEID